MSCLGVAEGSVAATASWLLALVASFLALQSSAHAQNVAGVTYVDQPTGIAPSVYLSNWPTLEPYIQGLRNSQRDEVLKALLRRATGSDISGGELNLLAQLEWQRGDLDAAEQAIAKAVASQPIHPLHAFQQAMISFAHLRRASGLLERWKWHRRTRDAYARTFQLDPRNVSARYYLAYSYMNTPAIGGGDKAKALELSEGGIALGQIEFYAVRADAHRQRGEREAAIKDYDRSIELKVIKLGGILDAAADELKRGELARAKRYYEWAVYCRADSALAFEGLGDYFIAVDDVPAAIREYQTALQKDPQLYSVTEKLARLSRSQQD